MSAITVKLLNTPQIFVNNILIAFPYKKAEALFYYIAVEKSITRDEAVAILWEDNEESVAKKNLRHALYSIKKLFGMDIIIAPQKYKLILNPSLDIDIDLDSFLANNRLELYTGGLLQGFGVKNAYAYEEWLANKQNSVRETYINRLFSYIESLPITSINEIEQYANKYMQEDMLDERIYLFLMETYRNNKLYHKGIKLYQRLVEVLDTELGITPNKDITALYHSLLSQWSENATDEEEDTAPQPSHFSTHNAELNLFYNYYNSFLDGNRHNIMLQGENGIGKTHLINTFLSGIDTNELLVLKTSCFQAEKNFPLQPWNSIMLKIEDYIDKNNIELAPNLVYTIARLFPSFGSLDFLSDNSVNNFGYSSCQSGIVKLFQLLTKTTRVLIFIDNIHSIDKSSLDLLMSVMRINNPYIMVICTSLDVMEYDIVTFISTLVKEGLLEQIQMSRLSKEETVKFIDTTTDIYTFDEEAIDRIYKETDGNIFFLLEFINNLKNNSNPSSLSLNAQGILNDRLNGISPEARQLLDIISLFHDFVTLDTLALIQDKNALDILDLLEELKEHALIIEHNEDINQYFTFIHSRMREFVYSKLSPSKLRILHNRVGEVLEQSTEPYNKGIYKRLIYHYELANNTEKVLYYKVINTEKYSSRLFELYPLLDTENDNDIPTASEILEYFNLLDGKLTQYKQTAKSFPLYDELNARLLHAKCHYCIQKGYYTEGLHCLEVALKSKYVTKNPDFHLQLLRQKIYYSIQVCDTDLMGSCTKLGLELSRNINNPIEHAIYHRLRGLYYILTSDYRQAIASLIKSIDSLERANINTKIYTLNISAAYNYLGELHRRQSHFKQAISYYNKAITSCTENACPINPTFLANLGRAYYDNKDYKNSEDCFYRAEQIYQNSGIIVGRATTMAYLALYTCAKGEYDNAQEYIKKSETSCETLNSPLEKGILKYIQHIIAQKYPNKLKCLTKSPEYYASECEKYFAPYNATYILQEVLTI